MRGSWHTSKPLRTHCHIDTRQFAQGKAASRPITKPKGRAINDNSTIPILIAPNSSPLYNADIATDMDTWRMIATRSADALIRERISSQKIRTPSDLRRCCAGSGLRAAKPKSTILYVDVMTHKGLVKAWTLDSRGE